MKVCSTVSAVVVHGLGGSGKTRVAIEYAHRYSTKYTALLFIRADSRPSLEQNLAALCGSMVLDLPERDTTDVQAQLAGVKQWLKQHAGWLLILDNVDSEVAAQAVQQILGELTLSGQVFITSRLSNWPGSMESLPLGALMEADAAAFLLERTENRRRRTEDDDTQARIIAAELGYLALGLEQAGAYINQSRGSFASYLTDWNQRREKVEEWFDRRLMEYPMSLAVTWQTSFDSLSQTAKTLLCVLAWFSPDPIPESLLDIDWSLFARPFKQEQSRISKRKGASKKAGNARTVFDARGALIDLEAHSLVTRADHNPSFTVHRLVQDVARCRGREEGGQLYLVVALQLLNTAFVGSPKDVRNWPILVPLAKHAEAVARHAETENIGDPTARLFNRLGSLCLYRAEFAKAEGLLRRALEIDEEMKGPYHGDVGRDLNNLAELLRIVGRLDEAEPLIRRAIRVSRKAYGPNDPEVATYLGNLASLLFESDRLTEAEPLCRRVLALGTRLYGSDHTIVATRLNNLAALLVQMYQQQEHQAQPAGQNLLSEAERLYGRALSIDENAYGPNHPDVSRDLSNLAHLLFEKRRFAEAEPLCRRALEIDEGAYGPNHPALISDLTSLAHVVYELEKFAEAETLAMRALQIGERAYGVDHRRVAALLSDLAALLQTTKRAPEAEPLLRRALQIVENAYGPDHPKVAVIAHRLAILLQQMNRRAEAEVLMRWHLEILLTNLNKTGCEHRTLREGMADYDVLLREMGYQKKQARTQVENVIKKFGFSLRSKPRVRTDEGLLN